VTLTAEEAADLRKELDAFIAAAGSLVRQLSRLDESEPTSPLPEPE
jgi:hypothetical protein